MEANPHSGTPLCSSSLVVQMLQTKKRRNPFMLMIIHLFIFEILYNDLSTEDFSLFIVLSLHK